MLQPIAAKTQKYSEIAYGLIKEAIMVGELEAGKSLVEEQLAVRLAISRTPVREALAILEHEGLIEPQGRRGLYVKILSRQEFVETYTANEAVEPILARRAAYLATEEEIQDMAALLDRGRGCARANDFVHFLANEWNFLRVLGTAAQNSPLMQFVLRNAERLNLYRLNQGQGGTDQAGMMAALREQEAMHVAILRRDPDEAAQLTIFHLQSARSRLGALFQAQESESP